MWKPKITIEWNFRRNARLFVGHRPDGAYLTLGLVCMGIGRAIEAYRSTLVGYQDLQS